MKKIVVRVIALVLIGIIGLFGMYSYKKHARAEELRSELEYWHNYVIVYSNGEVLVAERAGYSDDGMPHLRVYNKEFNGRPNTERKGMYGTYNNDELMIEDAIYWDWINYRGW